MGIWDRVKAEIKDTFDDEAQKKRDEKREQEKLDRLGNPLLVVSQSSTSEFRPKKLLVFEDRVEVRDPTFWTEVQSLSYGQVASITLDEGVFKSNVCVESTGGARLTVEKLPSVEVREARDLIQNLMSGDAPATRSETTLSEPTDQIRKLAELKDAGILTDEEFQRKKTEILDRM